MSNQAHLHFFYTEGGVGGTVPATSLGGVMSSGRILSQAASALTTLTGVTIEDGVGNAPGEGTFVYSSVNKTLTWQPYNGSAGAAVDVSVDGKYMIQGGNNGGALLIDVVAASLANNGVTNLVTITNLLNKKWADTTKDESDVGSEKYICIAVKNTSSEKMKGISLYKKTATPGEDKVLLFLDPAAVGDGTTPAPAIVANINTAPAASTFVDPPTFDDANAIAIGDLLAGEVRFYWENLSTPAGVTAEKLINPYGIGAWLKG